MTGPVKHSQVLAALYGPRYLQPPFRLGPQYPTRQVHYGPPPRVRRTRNITHTSRAPRDLPLLMDQVCRKADSDGTHLAGLVTSQACRSLRTRPPDRENASRQMR